MTKPTRQQMIRDLAEQVMGFMWDQEEDSPLDVPEGIAFDWDPFLWADHCHELKQAAVAKGLNIAIDVDSSSVSVEVGNKFASAVPTPVENYDPAEECAVVSEAIWRALKEQD